MVQDFQKQSMKWYKELKKSNIIKSGYWWHKDVWVKLTRNEDFPSVPLKLEFCLVKQDLSMAYLLTKDRIIPLSLKHDHLYPDSYVSKAPKWKEYYEVLPFKTEQLKLVNAFSDLSPNTLAILNADAILTLDQIKGLELEQGVLVEDAIDNKKQENLQK